MKYLKVYEGIGYDTSIYTKFIDDKFDISNKPFGAINYENNYDDKNVGIYIKLGGDIDPKYLNSIMEYLEYQGYIHIPYSRNYLYYQINLTEKLIHKMDLELEAKKYNL